MANLDYSADVQVVDVVVPGATQVLTVAVPGMQGPPGVFSVGNVTTGNPGTSAIVATRTDANGAQVVDFTIPRGNVGASNTLSIGTVNVGTAAATLTGTSPNQTLNLTLPQGPQGNPGPANTLSVSGTTTGAPGTNASVAISGTSPNQTLAFTIPRGDVGLTGPANTLSIGTVTTGAAGSSAAATVTGTSPNQVLNLTIPQGIQGPTGTVTYGSTAGTAVQGNDIRVTADQAAGTASIRTIGTGALQAAAGNHTHTPASIGAAAASHTHAIVDLTATGTKDSTTYLRGDGTWAVPAGGSGGSVTSANITDATTIGRTVLTSVDAAAVRTAIGAGTGSSNLTIGTTSTTAKAGDYSPPADAAATTASMRTLGTGALQAAAGNDSRLSDARTPTAHTHTASQISDSTTVGRALIVATDAATARTAIGAGTGNSNLAIGTTSTTAKAGDYTPPADAAANVASMRTLGTGALQAAAGNDSRLSDARTPTAHTHGVTDLTATGAKSSTTFLRGDNTWAVPAGSGGSGGANSSLDQIRYVSKSGSDSNDGLSWSTPKLTINAALTALAGAGVVQIGAGTYSMAPGQTPPDYTIIRGAGRGSTRINMSASGNLFNLVNTTNLVVEDLDLGFASASVTGTLVVFSNAFVCRFNRVGFIGNGSLGVGTAGQRGVFYTANAGDNYLFECFFSTLAVGVHADTVINWIIGSQFYANRTAVLGGNASAPTNGLFIKGCIFNEVGDYHIYINGLAQAWYIENCWFELATNAIVVGTTGGQGPTLFSLKDSVIGAQTTCLTLNSSETTTLDGLQFINTGTSPMDISTPLPANLPYGTIGQINSYTRTSESIRAAMPAGWNGARSYNNVLVLSSGASVPAGTPANTVILRTS